MFMDKFIMLAFDRPVNRVNLARVIDHRDVLLACLVTRNSIVSQKYKARPNFLSITFYKV